MRLDGGLGGIVDTAKNISLEKYFIDSMLDLSEGMIVIPGNNCDAWLVLHGAGYTNYPTTNKYFVFRVTEDRIDSIPKVYTGLITSAISGLLKVSPDRKRIVFANMFQADAMGSTLGSFELTKFNPDNGEISAPIQVNVSYDSFAIYLMNYDMEFSDNSNLLYHIQIPDVGGKSTLTQYNVSEHDSARIIKSMYQIDMRECTAEWDAFRSLRLYNKKMYVMHKNTLGVIEYPDSSGKAMNYIDSFLNVFTLTASNPYFQGTFSNELVYPMERIVNIKNIDAFCDVPPLLRATDSTATNYVWQDGTQGIEYEAPKSPISHHMAYAVEYTMFSPLHNCIKWHIDSFYVQYKGLEVEPVISVSDNRLSVEAIFDTYQWYLDNAVLTGETKNTLTVHQNGEYKVAVTKNGCEAESDPYKVNNANHITEQSGYDIEVYPNPTSDNLFVRATTSQVLDIKLYDVTGKEVSDYVLTPQGNAIWMLEMPSILSGVYFLEIKNNVTGEIQNIKVVRK